MQLIGMLDSPYVRRVAISLQLLGIPFEHRPLSVFRNYDEMRAINPVVKVPTLICDDGTVLMDSTLILELAAALAPQARALVPAALPQRRHSLRLTGLALAACEKSVALVYELQLRPAERQHRPWIERVTQQLQGAYRELDLAIRAPAPARERATIDSAGISIAVAWQFTQQLLPGLVPPVEHPQLRAFSADAEQLPEFRRAPHGPATYPVAV
jgi:glutathione S-transferase